MNARRARRSRVAEPPTPHHSDRLSPESRRTSITALRSTTVQQPLDILVVGGGVVGTGATLDAASRGLAVGLVERDDLASGTSSRSSRLAHGGLRYLEQGEFSLVHEALTERGLLLDRLAPHLVRPVPFIFPLTHQWERPYVGAGVQLYDLMSRVGAYGGTLPRPRNLSRDQVAELAPGLRTSEIAGAVRFHDAQINDGRHTIAVARTAASFGAHVATRCEVIGLIRDGERVVGATIRDVDADLTFNVFARVVVSATGVWTDELRALAGDSQARYVRQSKGVHLVVPRACIDSSTAIITRTPTSVLFMLPWGRHWLVGTTDTDVDNLDDEPHADASDIDYLLDQANRWLDRPLTHDDITGTYAGLRPLLMPVSMRDIAEEPEETAELSREHVILRPAPGFVAIAGGKYTTYRVMAADVIDAAADELDDDVGESVTDRIPLVGAAGYADAWGARAELAQASGLPLEAIEPLLRRHGDRIGDVLELVREDQALGDLLHPDAPYLRAEVVLGADREAAMTVDDILERRTRLAQETRDRGGAAVDDITALMAAAGMPQRA